MRKFARSLMLFAVLSFFGSFIVTAAHAVGTMVALSSAAFNCGSGSNDAASAVVVDGSGNIIVTGTSNDGGYDDFLTVKYDNNLVVISSATYSYGGYGDSSPSDVAVDRAGNIFVAGSCNDGSYDKYYTIKYDKDLNIIRCKGYERNGYDYSAAGVAVDGSDNIIVTGTAYSGSDNDYFTIKYDNALNVISSTTYNSGYDDCANGVAVDGSGNIFVTGYSLNSSGDNDFLTIKYDSNLNLVSSARYNGGDREAGAGVTVDGAGNVIVTGAVYNATYDCFTIKYDNNLNVISSATYNSGVHEGALAVAVDGSGNIIVAGQVANSSDDCLMVKYDGDLHVISTATYNGGAADEASGVVVDGFGNTIVTGYRNNGTDNDFFTIKYRGSPSVASVSPAAGAQSQTLDVTVTGGNFAPGAAVAFGGSGITVSTVTYNSATSLTANITISSGAATGKRSIIVTNTNLEAGTKTGAFEVLTGTSGIAAALDPASAGTLNLHPASGVDITVSFPAGTFSSAVTLTAKAATAPSDGGAYVKIGNICFEISNDLSLQPLKDVTVTITYNDSDIVGLDESKLKLCRYDNGKWIEMPSVVDTANNTITATLNHFSTFALAQILGTSNLSNVKVYPNPYNPKKDAQGLAIANLTADASLKIYNVAGELIAKPEYSDGSGMARWYGKNDGGNSVASGVYILFIDSPQGNKKVKIAVEK